MRLWVYNNAISVTVLQILQHRIYNPVVAVCTVGSNSKELGILSAFVDLFLSYGFHNNGDFCPTQH
jgi:hypothetical protein